MNCEKSKIFFSKNTSWKFKSVVKGVTNILVTEDLAKHLVFSDDRGILNGNLLLDRMKTRLSSWKAKILSFAVRTTLFKSMLSTMPTYLMQVVKFPYYICEEVYKINRIWQRTEAKKKIHFIN